MKNLVVVLTEKELWAERVGDNSILYWSLESLKRLIKGFWVHFVFVDTPNNKNALLETVGYLPWLKVGEYYSVKNPMSYSYGAMCAFPAFSKSFGTYLFNAGTVITPELLPYLGDVDWFAYTDPTMKRVVTPPHMADLNTTISSLGLMAFSNYDRFFNASKVDDPSPLTAFDRYTPTDKLVSTYVKPTDVIWVDSEEGLSDFEIRVSDAALRINE